MKGRCLCGKVTYWIELAPTEVVECACEDCKRVSGGDFIRFGFLECTPVVVGTVTPLKFAKRIRTFAPCCGTHLFWENPEKKGSYVVMNTLC